MANTSVDGLISGLSTSQLIQQLMSIERQPQVRLEQKRDAQQKVLDALRALKTKFSTVKTDAQTLDRARGWDLAKATSSDDTRVTATASEGAATGTLTFSVENLAVAGAAASSGTVASTDTDVTDQATIWVQKGTTRTEVTIGGTGTLADVVNAVNKADIGVRATAVKVATDSYKLQLSSTTTGSDTDISVDDGAGGNPFATPSSLGTIDQLVAGEDATIRIGGAGGYTVTRSSNTFDDVMSGVTINLLKEEAGVDVTVTVEADTEGLADRVEKMVDAVNAALTEIKAKTKYDAATQKGGVLLGDATVRRLQQRLVEAVMDEVAGNALGNVSSVGITLERDGTFKLDRAKFLEAHADDPEAVEGLLGPGTETAPGVAARVYDVGDDAVQTGDGLLSTVITGKEDRIRRLGDRIADWESRLAQRELALRRKFATLETTLGQLQAQSNWLSGQLAGLVR